MAALLATALACLSIASPASQTIKIPFSEVRAVLPKDGTIAYKHVWTENKWPGKKKSSFERNEMIEVAFGLGIRAKKGDRKNQKAISPGIRAEDGVIIAKGGWRAHKGVAIHDDYFDGTFSARIEIFYAGGALQASVAHFHFKWNRSVGGKIVGLFKDIGAMERRIAADMRPSLDAMLQGEVVGKVQRKIDELVESRPELKRASDRWYARIVGDQIHVTVVPNDVLVGWVDVRKQGVIKPTSYSGGDRDFGGNGPKIQFSVEPTVIDGEVRVLVGFKARETKSNWTEGKGSHSILIEDSPEGYQIVDVVRPLHPTRLHSYEDEDHSVETWGGIYGVFRCFGDTKGDDVGRYTRLEYSLDFGMPLLMRRRH